MREESGAAASAKIHILALISCLVLVAADQITKGLAYDRLKGMEPFVIWKGVFSLKYLENKGAAFGIIQGGGVVFLGAAFVVLMLAGALYRKIPYTRRFYLLRACAVLLCSGAVGNVIDRIKLGYVRDFFYFELIDFPIFNMADCYIVISGLLFIFSLIFYYKDEELKRFSFKSGKK